VQLEHSFEVPVPVDDAWNILLDVERVAPCMPGATLESVDTDEFRGKVKVKVGPIQVTYTGSARFVDRDDTAHQVTIEASGKEVRGSGTAKASVRASLASVTADRTRVDVLTDLAITGRPAQFGRGVMVDVGGKIIGQFAKCLEQLIESSGAVEAPAADASSAATGAERAAAVDTVSAVVDAPATEGVSDGATAGASSPLTRAGSADAGASAAAVNAVGAAAGAAAAPGAVSTGAAAGAAGSAGANGGGGPSGAAARPTPRPAPPQAAEAIDLLDAAGGPILKRVGPPLAGVALLLLLLRRWRKRRS
jgi:carbon monoxide dehydrogenase subunit G